jgi:hypothetical protein
MSFSSKEREKKIQQTKNDLKKQQKTRSKKPTERTIIYICKVEDYSIVNSYLLHPSFQLRKALVFHNLTFLVLPMYSQERQKQFKKNFTHIDFTASSTCE